MFRRISLHLLLFILIIVGCSVASAAFFYFSYKGWGLLCALGAIIYISKTLTLYNSVNRKLAYFFESIENDDYSINFIEKKGTSSEMFLSYILNKMKVFSKKSGSKPSRKKNSTK